MQKTEAPEELTREERTKLSRWCRREFPHRMRHGPGGIKDLVAECLDWHAAEGKLRANWVRACQTWIRRADRWERQPKLDPYRVEDGERGTDFEPIGDLLELVVGGEEK